jgi:Sulfotransferase domain
LLNRWLKLPKASEPDGALKEAPRALKEAQRALKDMQEVVAIARAEAAASQAAYEETYRAFKETQQAYFDALKLPATTQAALEETQRAYFDSLADAERLRGELKEANRELADLRQSRFAAPAGTSGLAGEDPLRPMSAIEQLNGIITSAYDADRYRARVAALADYCRGRSDDVEARLRLADAHLIGWAGGAKAWGRIVELFLSEFDPQSAIAALEEAARISPGREDVRDTLRLVRQIATPPMLLVALPRSGSVFLYHALTYGLNKHGTGQISAGAFPRIGACYESLAFLKRVNATAHTHLAPSRANLIELGPRLKLEHLHVHVRDPRQAMVSWFHFMPGVVQQEDVAQGLHYNVPSDYFEWSTERQIDWQIDNWLRWEIEWIDGWLRASDEPWFKTKIFYTTFEDMVREPEPFFARILEFYGIDPGLFEAPQKPRSRGDRNFRKGALDEWRALLTPAQIERASAMIPERLFDQFGWPKT